MEKAENRLLARAALKHSVLKREEFGRRFAFG
jgi:hypothetical protein